MESKVLDISLFNQGKEKIVWAKNFMPVLNYINENYKNKKPFQNVSIAGSLHITKETGVFIETLIDLGATVAWSASNPLSTQDDVAAYLAKQNIPIYAWSKMSKEDFYLAFDEILSISPQFIIDDGGDLLSYIYLKKPEYMDKLCGVTEQTSTGVSRLRAMEKKNILKHPVIAVNDSITKKDFDNVYGTGQSTLEGILRATSILIAGKKVVVAGYGACGRGIAMRARGFGADVIITEISSINALKAIMDGFSLMTMDEAAQKGDLFITATGMIDIIQQRHFLKMKDGAILANTGHYDAEISVTDLDRICISKREVRRHVREYELENQKKLYLLAEGKIVNLVCSDGHPSEVMDLSFANQVLALINLIESYKNLTPKVYVLPKEIDDYVSLIKLKSMGIEIDTLTERQKNYQDDFSLKT